MTENPETEAAPAAKKPDPIAGFKAMKNAEKILAVAAFATLIAFIFGKKWNVLFQGDWFETCAFLGAVGVILLVTLDLFGVKVVDAKVRTYLVILFAVLPALGFVIDALTQLWHGLLLAGSVAMAYAGAKITTREQIIKMD